jgi:hypothetical protein
LKRFRLFIKKLFPSLFYKLESSIIYSTEDEFLFVYEDGAFEVIIPETGSSLIFDISEIDNETISILKKMDPFKAIMELTSKELLELRAIYEKEDEFEICEFITKELVKRKKND